MFKQIIVTARNNNQKKIRFLSISDKKKNRFENASAKVRELKEVHGILKLTNFHWTVAMKS